MLLTLSQMAERCNRSTKTFRKYVIEYEVPHIRMGRDLLFNESKVLAHLEKITEQRRPRQLDHKPTVRPRGTASRLSKALGL